MAEGGKGHSPRKAVTVLERRVAELTQVNHDLHARIEALERERQGMVETARRMEASLEESRLKYRDLVENMTDVIYSTDLAGCFTSVSRAAEAATGLKAEQIIGTDFRQWLSEEDLAKVEGCRERALAGHMAVTQTTLRDKDGKDRRVEISIAPARVGGRTVGTQGIIRDITDRYRAEQAVRESEAMLRALFNATTESILLLDLEGRVLLLNETAAQRFGKSAAELLRTRVADVGESHFPLSVVKERTRRIREVLHTGRAVRFEDERAGRFFDTSAFPVFDARGDVQQIAIFGKDITEQRRARDEVKTLQRQLEFILGATKTGLDIIDRDFNLRYVDPAWQEIYGPYEGRKCYAYFMGRDSMCPTCAIPAAFASKQITLSDEVLVHEGGRPIQVTTIPFQSEDGEWLVAEVNVDIAARQELERSLRESEEKYRAVVECAGETIAVVDKDGVFQFMNSTGGRRLGGTPADFVGKTMWDFFPKDIADRQMDHVRAVIRNGREASMVAMSVVSGRPRWYNTTVEPLKDGAGKVTAALVMARDIHDLKQTQDELEAFREQMTRAEHLASLGTLGATLAHELTQPLTVIQLSIQNALKGLEGTSSPKAVREDLHDSLEEISNATAIIERFRSFVRQPSKEAVTNVAVHKVAQRILRLLEESTRRRGVTLESRDLGDLPPVRVRESELAQVFFVLSQNAIQAADPAKGSCLCVSGRRQGDSVELQFKDNCAGISADHLEHIFEPFFTTKPPGEGTGLGLCVVQRIVSQAGGHLRVESKLGRGTTFFVTLPIKGT